MPKPIWLNWRSETLNEFIELQICCQLKCHAHHAHSWMLLKRNDDDLLELIDGRRKWVWNTDGGQGKEGECLRGSTLRNDMLVCQFSALSLSLHCALLIRRVSLVIKLAHQQQQQCR